jgi:hypothetical protein
MLSQIQRFFVPQSLHRFAAPRQFVTNPAPARLRIGAKPLPLEESQAAMSESMQMVHSKRRREPMIQDNVRHSFGLMMTRHSHGRYRATSAQINSADSSASPQKSEYGPESPLGMERAAGLHCEHEKLRRWTTLDEPTAP